MVCCLLCARVQGIQNIVKEWDEQQEAVVHVGRIGMGRKRDEVLWSEYWELIKY